MCGRYVSKQQAEQERFWDYRAENLLVGFERYNICPSMEVPVVVLDERGGREGRLMRWGIIAPWAKEISSRYATFNARIETAAEKPAYRHAWRRSQRCLLPAIGYYEWRAENGAKQPYFIRRKDGHPLGFAGLYEPEREGGFPASCTIITRPASPDMQNLHPRMPVMLQPEHCDSWFADAPEQAGAMANEIPPPELEYFAVSTRVNNPRNEGEQCMAPTG